MTHVPLVDRRAALGRLAGTAALAASPLRAFAAEPKRSRMGLVLYCCRFRRDLLRKRDSQFDLYEPGHFLRHCQEVGAGGMQARLGVLEAKQAGELREYAAKHGLFVEAIVSPPKDEGDVSRFAAEIRTAADVGAAAARTVVMPGRRYERFETLEEFRSFAARARRMLELAAPVVEKHRVPLAVENHKDQRNDERVALFEHVDSEYVGACVDTGNSVALLEDPVQTVEALAPWAHSVHLKDQALQEYEDGFLLGDVPLGRGGLDLKAMVDHLRKAKPQVHFALELITRDALEVPCLTEGYWATMPGVSGSHLARTLRLVRNNTAESLQQVSSLPLEEQVELEDANVRASLAYARKRLGL